MPIALHADSPGIHKGAYVQATDPGAVGADKLWVDTSTAAPYLLKRRNAANSGWDAVGLRAVTSADIADGTLVDVDISASANIALSKLAAGAGGVLKSNGTVITAGNSINTNDIADGTIATGDLAANAVSQVGRGSPSSSGPTTASGTAALMPQMTVTLTTTGGPVLIWFDCTVSNTTVSATTAFDLYIDGAQVLRRSGQCKVANMAEIIAATHSHTPAAGSHTWEIRWFLTAGTSTSTGVERNLMVAELKR